MTYKLICGDALEILSKGKENSFQCCVTSPPYFGLRDYGNDNQIGLENTPEEYIDNLVNVFREVKRVLREDGTLWIVIGDSYNGSGGPGGWVDNKQTDSFKGDFKKYTNPNRAVTGLKPKDLIGIPWMLAFALRADGWWLRSDIIWQKPNPMPESVRDRPTKAHEYIFLLSKSQKYLYDANAIKEPSSDLKGSEKRYQSAFGGKKNEHLLETNQVHTRPIGMREFDGKRNRRSVWTVNTRGYKGAHFAVYPPDLIDPCILAGSKENDWILDPFCGSGTTGAVSLKHNRRFIGIDLNCEYLELAKERIEKEIEENATE